jgi:hypothetical protein
VSGDEDDPFEAELKHLPNCRRSSGATSLQESRTHRAIGQSDNGILHIAFNYVVCNGRRVRKDTKTHQDRYLAIDPVTCAMIREYLDTIRSRLAAVGLELPKDAYVFSNDPMGANPWNPDWATHKASDLAAAAGVKLNIKGLRHYTASQLLAARFDLRNTAARLGHGSGGATTLRHYADPVSEVDRRAAAYLAQLTAGSAAHGGHRRHPGRHRLSMSGPPASKTNWRPERAYPGHVEEDVMAQEAAAKNSGRKARPAAAKPVPQTVQDALRRLAVVEHMTYPAEVNGQMNVRLEGIMSARQLEALRKWLAQA